MNEDLEKHAEHSLHRSCMIDFYMIQTEDKDATMDDVLDYFEKLTNNIDFMDMTVYKVFEDQYKQEANQ
jgi:hypothetical protein